MFRRIIVEPVVRMVERMINMVAFHFAFFVALVCASVDGEKIRAVADVYTIVTSQGSIVQYSHVNGR